MQTLLLTYTADHARTSVIAASSAIITARIHDQRSQPSASRTSSNLETDRKRRNDKLTDFSTHRQLPAFTENISVTAPY